jgi:hypothetical protein
VSEEQYSLMVTIRFWKSQKSTILNFETGRDLETERAVGWTWIVVTVV